DDLKIFFKEDYLKTHENLWNFAKNKGESPPNIGLLYELIYSTLEKSMGARKNVREFRQSVIVDSGRKCSVCGERDLIFFRESVNKEKFLRFNRFAVDLTEKKLVSPKFLADGEGLCAVCFIKRTFEIYLEKEVSQVFKDITFPSTAEIASCDFKERALQKAKEEFINYQKKLKGILSTFQVEPLPKLKRNFENIINIEGALFYDENLRIKYFKDEFGVEVDERTLNELKNLLKDITDKVGKPNSYYAILYLDGDNMGKWLSGELLPEIEFSYNSSVWEKLDEDFKNRLKEALPLNNFFKPRKILTPAVHASISTALRNYALEFVRKIVEEEHLGKLIYAGGDDVLAFVNLKDLLDVMHKLRWAFSGKIKIVNGRIEVDLTDNTGFVEKNGRYLLTMGSQASASVGVVIAHYKTPLQIVIKKVFEMEKEAKSEGRNGFAICLMRRSGEERVAKAKWVYEEKDTVKILKNLINAFDEENQDGYIAKSFIQKVYNNFIRLKENERFIATGEIFNVELSRLLKRSYNLPKGIKVEEEKKKGFLNSVFENMKNLFWDTGESLDNFVNFLIILVFILKAEE
ncbi:MAG: type III-B CRISPR-associated protein Cas10/Cmr2, partial [Candidatus Hydrothermales bacterium]